MTGRPCHRLACWAAAQDVLIELPGALFRLDPGLALQHGHAELVLPKGATPPAELGIQAHQRAGHRLLQGIERDEPERRP